MSVEKQVSPQMRLFYIIVKMIDWLHLIFLTDNNSVEQK